MQESETVNSSGKDGYAKQEDVGLQAESLEGLRQRWGTVESVQRVGKRGRNEQTTARKKRRLNKGMKESKTEEKRKKERMTEQNNERKRKTKKQKERKTERKKHR